MDPVDLSEYARLKNIPELLRQAGVNYPGLKQAPPPQALQDLLRSAPVGTAAAGGGLGFLGMLAALLAQGGDTDPNAAKFYAERQRQQQLGQTMPMGAFKANMGGQLPAKVPNLEDQLLYADQIPMLQGMTPRQRMMLPPDLIPPARRAQ